jgi:hypothetical protein
LSKQLESDLQKKCIKYLKDKDIYYINKYGDGRSGLGAPDLITCINGRFVAFELKVGNNTKSNAQEIHKIRIERNGGTHYTPYTLEEFIESVEREVNK